MAGFGCRPITNLSTRATGPAFESRHKNYPALTILPASVIDALGLIGALAAFVAFGLGGFAAILAFGLPVLRGHPLGFGWEEPIDSMFLEVEVVDKPESLKAAASEHYRIPIGDFGKTMSLAHTVIYDDPRMQQKLVAWIRGASRC